MAVTLDTIKILVRTEPQEWVSYQLNPKTGEFQLAERMEDTLRVYEVYIRENKTYFDSPYFHYGTVFLIIILIAYLWKAWR